MSNSVDNRVVQMEFDNKQFEKGVKTTLGSLDKLSKSLKLEDSSKGLKDLQKTADRFNIDSVGKAADEAGTHFTAMQVVAFTALQRITNAAITYGKRIASALTIDMPKQGFSKYEQKMNAVQTIMFATEKPIEEVEEVLERLLKYTDETSYSFTDMASSIGKFTSANVELDRAEVAVEGIANWAASAGRGISEASGAFYNMSQAIAAGSMKMQDWKSIQNMNMNTKKFKETAIETTKELIEMGKITGKDAQIFKSANVTVENFESTLSKGWFTTEAMLATLEKYADQTTEFGLAAYHAAQEAKTFTDVVDALKDAWATGWSITWQQIFGNKDEAAKMWTNLCNGVAEFTSRITEARNKALKFWHDTNGRTFLVEGITSLLEGLGDTGNAVLDSLSEIFSPKHGGYNEKTSLFQQYLDFLEVTEEEYDNHYKTLNESEEKVEDTFVSFDAWLEKRNKTWKSIFGEAEEDETPEERAERIKAGWEAIRRGDVLIELTQKFKAWAESMKPSEERLEQIHRIFNGIFSVVKIVFTVIKSVGRIIGEAFKGAGGLGDKIFEIGASIGDLIAKFATWLEENDYIYETLKTIYDFIATTIGKIPGWIDDVITKIENLTGLNLHEKKFESFGDFLGKIWGFLVKIYKSIGPVAQAIRNVLEPYIRKIRKVLDPYLDKIGTKLGRVVTKIVELAKKVKDFISGVADGSITVDDIAKRIKTALKNIKDNFLGLFKKDQDEESLDGRFDSIKELIESLKLKLQGFKDWITEQIGGITASKVIFGGIGLAIVLFFLAIAKLTNGAAGFLWGLKRISQAVADFVWAMEANLKSKSIKNIAISIFLLAASIGILALIPADKLKTIVACIITMGIILGALLIITLIIAKIEKAKFNNKAVRDVGSAMLMLGASVLLMAIALKKLDTITDMNAALENLIHIGAFLAIAITVLSIIETYTLGDPTRLALTIMLFAIACTIMVGNLVLLFLSLKLIEQIPLDEEKLKAKMARLYDVLAMMSLTLISGGLLSRKPMRAAAGILLLTISFLLIIGGINKISKIPFEENNIAERLKLVKSVLRTMEAIVILVSRQTTDTFKAAKTMGIMTLCFLGLIYACKMAEQISHFGVAVGRMLIVLAILLAGLKLLSAMDDVNAKVTIKLFGLAAAILAAGIALRVMDGINWWSALTNALAMGIVLAAVGAAFGIAKKISGNFKSFLGMSLAIVAISAALGLLSNFADPDGVLQTMFSLSLSIIAFGAACKLASKLNSDNFKSIIVMTVAMAVIAAALYLLQKFDWVSILFTAISLSLVILAIGQAVNIAGQSSSNFGAILAMAFPILAVGAALYFLAGIPFDQLIGEVIAIAGAILVMALAVKLISPISGTLLEIVGPMILFAAACAACGAALWVVGWGFEKFIEALGPIGDAIMNFFGAVADIINIFVDTLRWLLGSLQELVNRLPSWSSIFGKSSSDVADSVTELGDAYAEAGDNMLAGALNMETASEISNGVGDTLSEVGNTFSAGASGVNTGRQARYAPSRGIGPRTTSSAEEEGAEQANAYIDSEVETLENRSDEVAEASTGWLGGIGAYAEQYGLDLSGSGEGMMGLFGGGASLFGEGDESSLFGGMDLGSMLGSFTGMADISGWDTSNISDKLSEALGFGGEEGVAKVIETLNTSLSDNSETLTEIGNGSAESYFVGFTDSVSSVGDGLQINFQDLGNSNAALYAENLVAGVKDTGLNLVTTVVNGIKENMEQFKDVGKESIENFAAGLKENVSMVTSSAAEDAAAAVYGFQSQTVYMAEAGRNYVRGFANGMYGLKDWLYHLAYSIGMTVIQGIKDAGNTFSPSREMEKLGGFYGEGFIIGLSNTSDDVYKTGRNLANSALGSLDSMLGVIEEKMNAEDIYEPTIRPILDLTNVASGAGQINTILNSDSKIATSAIGYASQMRTSTQRLEAMNQMLQQNQNRSPNNVTVNVTTKELSNSTVDYLINRVNRVLGGRV